MLKFLNKDNASYKRLAMTLAEVLLVFSIIGVIASMTIYTAKPFDKNMKYAYAKAYDTLNVAFYNSKTTLPRYLAPTNGQSAEGMDYDWPDTSENFCKMLLEYINFKADKGEEDQFESVGGSIPINQADNKFSVANCSAKTIDINQKVGELNKNLEKARPHFIAANGMKFWIGHQNEQKTWSKYPLKNSSSNMWFSIRYYPVIVDLNGDLRPNSAEITDKKVGDIVLFLVTDQNEVIPVGRPEIDRRYLSARVVYNVNIDQSAEASTSNTMTFYEAKRSAWAETLGTPDLYVLPSNPMSGSFYSDEYGIKKDTAFYQNYWEPPYREANDTITYDMEWCGRKKATLVNTEDPDAPENFELNPNACYVKITDYF